MTTITAYECDRCKRRIEGERWAFELEALPRSLVMHAPRAFSGHLCPKCQKAFRAWLAARGGS